MSTMIKTANPSSAQEKRALLAQRLRQAAAPKPTRLSFAQERLWFLEQLEPNSPLYNLSTVARLTGKLDLAALKQSLNALVKRHPGLRTRIMFVNGEAAQIVDGSAEIKLEIVDLGVSSVE